MFHGGYTGLFDEALVGVRTMKAYLATSKSHETNETVGVVVSCAIPV